MLGLRNRRTASMLRYTISTLFLSPGVLFDAAWPHSLYSPYSLAASQSKSKLVLWEVEFRFNEQVTSYNVSVESTGSCATTKIKVVEDVATTKFDICVHNCFCLPLYSRKLFIINMCRFVCFASLRRSIYFIFLESCRFVKKLM